MRANSWSHGNIEEAGQRRIVPAWRTASRGAAMLAALVLAGCATGSAVNAPESLAIAPAPISFDGNVAGRATDFVFVLVKDPRPSAPGIRLAAGERLMVALPKAIQRNDAAPLRPDSDFNLLLTRGWPQAAVRQKGQYRIVYEAATNSIGVHALVDVEPQGANAPGIKVIHLRGKTFLNTEPGEFPVRVSLFGADGREARAWQGNAKVLFDPPKARLAPSNFHLPPGTNSNLQSVGRGAQAPHWLGLLLWDGNGSPMNRVGIAPRDLGRYARYTGGLLVQDTDGDGKLDSVRDRVVGGIIGAAPAGAKGQSALSPVGRDGKPTLSGAVARHAKFPNGGKPNPGLLPVQFRAGDKAGAYRPTFELIGGNAFQFTIEAR